MRNADTRRGPRFVRPVPVGGDSTCTARLCCRACPSTAPPARRQVSGQGRPRPRRGRVVRREHRAGPRLIAWRGARAPAACRRRTRDRPEARVSPPSSSPAQSAPSEPKRNTAAPRADARADPIHQQRPFGRAVADDPEPRELSTGPVEIPSGRGPPRCKARRARPCARMLGSSADPEAAHAVSRDSCTQESRGEAHSGDGRLSRLERPRPAPRRGPRPSGASARSVGSDRPLTIVVAVSCIPSTVRADATSKLPATTRRSPPTRVVGGVLRCPRRLTHPPPSAALHRLG